jgi:cobalt-zinc-cadmium efflux system outer membrane protein
VPNVTLFGAYAREVGREAVFGGVSVPTPLWYLQQGHIATALGAQRQEEAELFRSKNDLARAMNQHAREAETAQEQILVYEEGLLKQAQEALRIAQLSFRQGASSLLDVLDAQRVQRQITVDYNQARFELSLALTRYERAVGGPL